MFLAYRELIQFCVCVYVYVYTHIAFHILSHYVLSQDIEYSSLCRTAGPSCLSTLHMRILIRTFAFKHLLFFISFHFTRWVPFHLTRGFMLISFRSSLWHCGWLFNGPINGRGNEEEVQTKGKIGWMWFVTCTNQEKKFINLPSKCNHGQRKCFILFIIVIGWPLSTDRSNLCIENSWQNELPFSALKRSNTFQQEKKNIFIKQNQQISLTMKVSFETKLEKLKFEFQTVNYIFYFLGLNFAG